MKQQKTFYSIYGKRWFDLILTIPGFIVISPLLILIALLIKFKMGSPVLFRQMRPGLNGKPFTLYKFRTMTDDRDAEGKLLPDGQRQAKLGRFLRASSLDELPELWNVLKGEMSLVGPRPLLMEYMDYFTKHEQRRHLTPPGITGLAQVNGRTAISWEDRLNHDIKYVENLSLQLDCLIILETINKVLHRNDILEAAPQGPFHLYRQGQNKK